MYKYMIKCRLKINYLTMNSTPVPKVLKYGEMCLRRGSDYIREIGNPSYGSSSESFYKAEEGMLIAGSNGRKLHEVGNNDFLAIESGGVCVGHVPVNEAFQGAPEIFGDQEFNKIYSTLYGEIQSKISLLLKLFDKVGLKSELKQMRIEAGNHKVITRALEINELYSSEQYLRAIIGEMQTEVAAWWNKNVAKDAQAHQLAELENQLPILDDLKMYCAQYVYLGLKNTTDMEKPRYKMVQDLVREVLYSSYANTAAFEKMVTDVNPNVRLPEDENGDDTDFVNALRKMIHPAAQFYSFASKICRSNNWGDPARPEILEQHARVLIDMYPLKDQLLEEVQLDASSFGGSLLAVCSQYLESQRVKKSA